MERSVQIDSDAPYTGTGPKEQSIGQATDERGLTSSYTATLDAKRVREKVAEESAELCEAQGFDEVVWEAADLIYFVSVLLQKENVSWGDILAELDRRHKK